MVIEPWVAVFRRQGLGVSSCRLPAAGLIGTSITIRKGLGPAVERPDDVAAHHRDDRDLPAERNGAGHRIVMPPGSQLYGRGMLVGNSSRSSALARTVIGGMVASTVPLIVLRKDPRGVVRIGEQSKGGRDHPLACGLPLR
jgi:hypothetical protein